MKLYLFSTFRIRALRRNALREKDRQECDQDDKCCDHVCHGPVTWASELREDPDRQGGLLTCGKRCDDHFIEGKREGKHPTGEKCGCNIWQYNIAEGLE